MASKHEAEIFLRQNITDSLKSAGAAVVKTRAGLSAVGPAAKASFEMAGSAITVLNQGLEIGKKALETFRATIGASIETSLQFRQQGDETVQYFKDLGRESELVKARLGDALLPVIKGFTEATGAATGSISDWIAENQKLIGQGLVDFLGTTATMLTTGIATGTTLVVEAWHGWQAVVGVVQVAVNEFFSLAIKNFDFMLGGLQRVASAFGADGMAGAIASAREGVQGLGAEFDRSSAEAQQGILETGASLKKTQDAIARVEGAVKRVIKQGMVQATQEVAKATTGLTKNVEEQTAALQKQGDIIDGIMQRRIAAIEAEQALREKDARGADANQQAAAATGGPMTAGEAGMGLLGSAGSIGGAVSAGLEGGPMAGLAAVGGMLIENSEALSGILEGVTEVVMNLFQVFEPLFQSLQPLVEVVGVVASAVGDALAPIFVSLGKVIKPLLIAVVPIVDLLMTMNPLMLVLQAALGALQPVLEILGKIMKRVAGFMLSIAEGIAGVWNGIVEAIGGVLKKLGSISVFGKKPLGFLEDWGNDLIRSASISTAQFEEARRRLNEETTEASGSMAEGARSIAESTRKITASVSNVPAGINMAFEEFRNAIAFDAGGLAAMGPGKGNSFFTEMQTARQNNFLGNIVVNGVTDVESLTAELTDMSGRRAQQQQGAVANSQRMPV